MTIRLAFRLDDPSPVSDHALEARVIEVFARYRIPLTIAVVPFVEGEGGRIRVEASVVTMPHLFQALTAGRIEVALHGYSHRDRANCAGGPSECQGLPLAAQRELFGSARRHLMVSLGARVGGFIPPWNSYDANTVVAAAACGFEYLSGGERGAPGRSGLRIIPRTCGLNRLELALREAARFTVFDPIIVAVLHPDDFTEFRSPPSLGEQPPSVNLPRLEQLLHVVTGMNDAVQCITLDELSQRISQPLWWWGNCGWLERLPFRLRKKLPRYAAFTADRSRVLWRAWLQDAV